MLTQELAERAYATAKAELSPEIMLIAHHCLLDYVATGLAGSREPCSTIVLAEMEEQGGYGSATVLGHSHRLPALSAALVNGTAAHALDFDDLNLAMFGHPSAVLFPGLIATAEERKLSGDVVLKAFIAGYDLQCHVGLLVAPSHYERGFHATGTIGSFGAAASCAVLLGADAGTVANALGIAATQASGLKAMFGTMCKPFHAGKASYNGLLAARLAKRGFGSRADVIECHQGFAFAQSEGISRATVVIPSEYGTYLHTNLFKYHASCYGTHAAIDAARAALEAHTFHSDDVQSVQVRVHRSYYDMCNIQKPTDSQEAKFSLRLATAMALVGSDTCSTASYSQAVSSDSPASRLSNRTSVDFPDDWPLSLAEVEIKLVSGETIITQHTSGVPSSNLIMQQRFLEDKFRSLVGPLMGELRAEHLIRAISDFQKLSDVREFTELLLLP